MKINNKYIIGTHTMFYEIEILPEFIDSLIQCSNEVENPENITYDFIFNISEYLEGVDTTQTTKDKLVSRFESEMVRLSNTGVNVRYNVYSDDSKLYSIADYRRDFNYHNCSDHDYLIWGETDSLFPKQLFDSLESIKNYANSQNIHRYTVWFAERKMWDASWAPLEHIDFENEKYISIKDFANEDDYKKKIAESPHSIRYVMNLDEMNEINDRYDDLNVQILQYPKFNGCGLVMSSDFVKAGVNIPRGIFGVVAEDTAMMISAQQVMGKAYIQFVVKNILLVHNREHTRKRMYCVDKETHSESGMGDSYQHGKGKWFDRILDMCKQNVNLLGYRQDRFFTIKDFENENRA